MVLPYPLIDSLMMFFIYSFIGWIVEVVYYGITEGHFVNRGFLAGPLCPVYGLGFYAALWALQSFKENVAIVFFGSAIACTIVELIAGLILYYSFHLRWWDYTEYKLNFKGFICLLFKIYWCISGTLCVYALHTEVLKIIVIMNTPVKISILSFLSVILIIDIIASVANTIGFAHKLQAFAKISATVKMTSDFIGGNIYDTVDTVMEVESPIKESYDSYRKLVAEHKAEENELAKKHRAEEREYFQKFLVVKSFNVFDKRHLKVVNVGKIPGTVKGGVVTAYDKALKAIRFDYFKSTIMKSPTKMVPEDPSAHPEIADESTGSV